MAKCLYCGRSSGFLHRQHADCKERHDRAVFTIPGFFSKVISSTMSPKQFGDLLWDASEACFINRDELKMLCADGLSSILDSVVRDRPATPAEIQRISELVDTLETRFPEGLALDEMLIKVGMVSELREGRLPSPVTVVGSVPIKLGPGELILWIFNQTRAYRQATPHEVDEGAASHFELNEPVGSNYVTLGRLAETHIPSEMLNHEVVGDLVVTNRNIYFLKSETSQALIPLVRIVSFQAYAEGIHIACDPVKRSRTFLLATHDSWFAANLINGLVRRISK